MKAVLNYERHDRLPVVHFGFWNETLDKWAAEGHLTEEEARTWEEHYKHRYQFQPGRVSECPVRSDGKMIPFEGGGLDFLKSEQRDYWYGLHCGSLFGQIRDVIGVENCAYLYADDEGLFSSTKSSRRLARFATKA